MKDKEDKAFDIMRKHMWTFADWLNRRLDPKNPKDDMDGPKSRAAFLEQAYLGEKDGYYTWRLQKSVMSEGHSMGMEVTFKVNPK